MCFEIKVYTTQAIINICLCVIVTDEIEKNTCKGVLGFRDVNDLDYLQFIKDTAAKWEPS